MWLVYALLSAFFAALTAIFAKVGVTGINPNLATAIRTLVILFITWCIVLVRGEAKGLGTLSRQHVLFLFISGAATGLSWLFYFKALHTGKVSQVAPVDKLSLIFAILLAAVFLGEPISVKNAMGILLVAGGIILISIK